MENKTVGGIIVIVGILVGLYLFLTSLQRPEPVQEIVLPEETQVPLEQAEVREIAVSGKEFSFDPASITLSEGEKVRVVFTNVGQAPHDFTIEGLGVKTEVIGSGKTDSVEFTAPASGNYTFFCSVPGHREAGMEGNLIVE